MAKVVNRTQMTVSGTPGTGVITLGSAVSGYQTFAQAGVNNTDVVNYVAIDGANWEYGYGTYASSGTKLTRTTILASSNGGSAVSLTSAAIILVDVFAEDTNPLLASYNVSGVASIQDTSFQLGFDIYDIIFENLVPSVSTGYIYFNVATGGSGGSIGTIQTTNYLSNALGYSTVSGLITPSTDCMVIGGWDNENNTTAGLGCSGSIRIGGVQGTTNFKSANFQSVMNTSANTPFITYGGGHYIGSNAALTGFQLCCDGNLTGIVKVYGRK